MATVDTTILRKLAKKLYSKVEDDYLLRSIYEDYGIVVVPTVSSGDIESLQDSLSRLPKDLVRDCGLKKLEFKDLGPSKKYYPNHGRYEGDLLILSEHLFKDPFLEVDFKSGNSLNKLDQILFHELGHGWDEEKGSNKELSLEPEWLELSGWSEKPIKGHKRLIIREKGCPEMVGEYYYAPDAKFCRYYGKRNPWDDWADSFAYYVGGLKGTVPEGKREYFDEKLERYYS